jgi:hypothetical protein
MNVDVLAQQFIQTYYEWFNPRSVDEPSDREQCGNLYIDESILTMQDQQFIGREQIMERLLDSRLSQVQKAPQVITAQPSIHGLILVAVQGAIMMSFEEENSLPFIEIFLLVPDLESGAYFILNQIHSTSTF